MSSGYARKATDIAYVLADDRIEIIFLTNKPGNDPESELLLQVQRIISEYERMKIMERIRRGKIHAAKHRSHSVLVCATYWY